jgi:peptidoglycan hydrolase-like protein with peptidoglycan-binding domain
MSKIFKFTLASMFVAAFVVSTASASTATFSTNMTVGSKGAEVKALQVFLNSCTDTALAVPAGSAGSTGYESMTFGPATKAAVMSWQSKTNNYFSLE